MTVRGPDPHNLRSFARKSAPIIEIDRECAGCGYNLRGLRLGVNCPECGMPSLSPLDIDDPLSAMPMRVILTLVRGCWVGSACVALMVITLLAERFGAISGVIAMPILAALSILWALSVIWLTPVFTLPQAVSRGFGARSRLRAAARWLQVGWVVGLGAATANALWPTPPAAIGALLSTVQLIGLMIGLAGLVVLSILMERLAEWARDEDAQRMFNWAVWSWPLAILLYAPIQFFIGSWLGSTGQYRLGAGFFVLLWIVAIGTFPYGLLMLAKSVTLSVLHNIERRDRALRKQERDELRQGEAGERAARTEPQPMRMRPAAPKPQNRPGEHGSARKP